ncbi:MAG: CDP-diacylglycerol--serine O-phosphatidyltransferase [Ignavibacteria bacterium]|jgi:CDP-diacylglycerol--serine O-phosphatidyltransferase|nr:CDP-diacylglycerol--serine O-phosphatidyltransferase [Ignavibacteria bacterium]MBK7446491.1 CDP-diacylglycerol--serine O-phosphatidyltransferase [Ignavibacteria bacterium]MBK8380418.1 CDP-diacylglycerol--serine O-phosphatidyltransferase [Ignavibacteria bacterium]MBK9405030.1 CDP-diacylglycerol--serine O-phosphatidyltransferase [Ignavibacteria bacterium]
MLISKKFIPSLFTILNAFCGFLSVINSANHEYETAAVFIIIATLFDAVDGLAARLTKSSSEFGVELDSLSDVISFGLAPSFLIYGIYLNELGDIGVVISSLIMVFAAIRLARFNVQLVGFDKDKFNGLPAPMAAMTIVTYILFYHDKIFSLSSSKNFLFVLSIILPVLMVSRIKYESLPKPSLFAIKKNPIIFVILLIAVIITLATGGEGSFSFCLFYIFSGIIISLKNFVFKKKLNKDDILDEHLDLKKSK